MDSSEIIRGCSDDIVSVYWIIAYLTDFVSQCVVASVIGCYLIYTDPLIAITVILLMLLQILCITYFFKPATKRNGEIKLRASTIQKKSVIECVGGIKEIMIKHREELFLEEFEKAGDATRKAELIYNTLKESPDRIVEGVCLSGIICIVCIRLMLSAESAVAFVPKLAIFAMGAFKLLPCVGKLASRMNAILYYMPGLNNVYRNYKEVEEYETEKRVLQEHVIAVGQQPDTFHETLSINHVFWQYTEGSAPILTDANLTIHRGESIAFIGSSGSGKTTLLNILLGLMKPLKGTVEMDGVDIYRIPQTWGRIVGCVPQFVYLADESIRRNIAFGIREDDIDDHVIWDVLEKVQLTPFVEALPAGLDTIVGERGIKFSGGQRQRIALARALYDAPEILILDEATASLDNETEAAVMEAIELLQGQITLIIVAHRLTTIKNCDHIYEVGNGVITERCKESVLSNITLDGREETK